MYRKQEEKALNTLSSVVKEEKNLLINGCYNMF